MPVASPGIVHGFRHQLEYSTLPCDEAFWEAFYRQALPTYVKMVDKTKDKEKQEVGIDRIVHLSSGQQIKVDEKKRERPDRGDILLELVSDVRTGSPGWIEKDLAIDYIAYAFMPSRRVYFFPWHMLLAGWAANKTEWLRCGQNRTRGFKIIECTSENERSNSKWTTRSLIVPTNELIRGMVGSMQYDVYLDNALEPETPDLVALDRQLAEEYLQKHKHEYASEQEVIE